jgi:hypothetical protein
LNEAQESCFQGMNSFMIPVLLFLLITGLLGSVAYVYVYLRREQDKLIPQNNFESEFNISKRSSKPSLLSGNCTFLSVAGIILVVSGGLWVSVVFLDFVFGSGDNGYWLTPYTRYAQFFRICFLLSLAALFGEQIIFFVITVLSKFFQVSTHNKIIAIFCILLVAGVSSRYIDRNRRGCLWWECAPTRSFDVADLALPSNLFPAYIDVGKFYSLEDGNPETYQNGSQAFWSNFEEVGFYKVEMYSSNKKAAQRFKSSKAKLINLNRYPTTSKDIIYVSPLADQFYISCVYNGLPNCIAIAQYQEFYLYLGVSMRNGMTTQVFQQVVIYMDRQISKYLYEK